MNNLAPRLPLVIAHRGASGHAVENSWHAIGLAVSMGCEGIEIDVHATRDGALVVHHDPVLRGGLVIGHATRDQVLDSALADDSAPPLLDAVLARYGAAIQIFIEAKSLPPGADAALLAIIDASAAPGNLHVHAFDHRIIARLGALRPDLSLGVLSASYPLDPVAAMRDTGARTLWQEHHLIDAALVEAAHALGGQVIAWTVNSRRDAERLTTLGVAGLCGNWPERLRAPEG
ncbi:MAG: glycerophosphodiester phosphodiesterase [Gemmatimonadales bacterium]|nr:glycerophosphodiester phosphodiesterase [Gemmatimonadales bacterium]